MNTTVRSVLATGSLAAMVLALVLSARPVASPEQATTVADLVITNGKVVTVEDGAPDAQAVAASGGKILAVGSKIRTALNGKLCVDLDDPKGERQGIIAVQVHSGGPMEVQFKDFELEVNPKGEMKTVK